MQPTADPGVSLTEQHQCRDGAGAALEEALAAFAADPAGSTAAMRSLQKSDRAAFARAGALLLGLAELSPEVKVLAGLVAPDALDILLGDQMPLPAAAVAAQHITEAEPLFDIRMIRKVLQGSGEVNTISTALVLRLLQILDKTSDCTRLTPHLIQFLRHPSQHVRSKTVLLMGRGNLNMSRTREFLLSQEARVRANAVESLWDRPEVGTQKVLLECSQDPNQRVAVNALVGLCRLGDSKAPARLLSLASSENPVARAGAAWGMGQVNRPEVGMEFTAALEMLAGDPEQKVQSMARRSLEKLAAQPVAGAD